MKNTSKIIIYVLAFLVLGTVAGITLWQRHGSDADVVKTEQSIKELRAKQAELDEQLSDIKVQTETLKQQLETINASGDAVRKERQMIEQQIIQKINEPLKSLPQQNTWNASVVSGGLQ